MERNISVIKDVNGKQIVIVNDIRFKGKRNIDWDEVEQYLKQYVGEFIEIAESKEIIYIGSDLPDEYSGSKYTAKLKGALAKAKANASQGIPEIIEIAENKRFQENLERKHSKNSCRVGDKTFWKQKAVFIWYHKYKKRNEHPAWAIKLYGKKPASFMCWLYDRKGEKSRENVYGRKNFQ